MLVLIVKVVFLVLAVLIAVVLACAFTSDSAEDDIWPDDNNLDW